MYDNHPLNGGRVEKQDTSGNERELEHECESETVDHVMRATIKAGLILKIVARTGLK